MWKETSAGEFQEIKEISMASMESWSMRCDWGGSSHVEWSGVTRLQLEIHWLDPAQVHFLHQV